MFYFAKQADIFLLTNHRSEWICPLLSETEEFFKDVFVSDEIGVAKPSQEVFEYLLQETEGYNQMLFVDNGAENVDAARAAGIPSLLARKEDPAWRDAIISWLEE